MAESSRPRVGTQAPDFALESATGQMVSLADFRGRGAVVVFFYPRDDSPVCTAEACSFRDRYEDFRDAGAQVIGISNDSNESHRRFARRNRLPFLLLSDPDGAVRARYGAKTLGVFPGRTTFLIDKRGVVRHVFSSQLFFTRHVSEMLGVLQTMRAEDQSSQGDTIK